MTVVLNLSFVLHVGHVVMVLVYVHNKDDLLCDYPVKN